MNDTLILPQGFRLVYQGGHHDVYCNGTAHIWTKGGGFTRCSEPRFYRHGACDCAKYKKAPQ